MSDDKQTVGGREQKSNTPTPPPIQPIRDGDTASPPPIPLAPPQKQPDTGKK